jgi:trehalose 6-phosphate synthase/phosphatase
MGALLNDDNGSKLYSYDQQQKLEPMTIDDFDELLAAYIDEHGKLALLLDCDGTLVPIAPTPELAFLPEETKRILTRLSNNADVQIAVISGRKLQDVQNVIGIEGLTYAGNHGLEILHPDGTLFVHPVTPEHQEDLNDIKRELEEQCCNVEGVYVEAKGPLVTLYYKNAPQMMHQQLKAIAMNIITSHKFVAHTQNFAIEAMPPVRWDKGRACIHILRTMYGVDWLERVHIIYCGDDYTDEDAMRALKGIAMSFRITSSHAVKTAATRRLSNTDSVVTLLRWLDIHMQGRPMKVNKRSSIL